MKTKAVRDPSKIGALDYVLTAIGCSLAVYSAGMAIGQPTIGYFCASLVLLGIAFSFLVRLTAENTQFVTVDGILYAGAVSTAIILIPRLNNIMPEGGFPQMVIIAGVLCWMLILGSFFTWRDGTLLFQAIPAIALFGLVGCYDTFRNVTFAFFGFLLCLATLFSRAHTRAMLQQAVESGYFDRAEGPGRRRLVEKSMAMYQQIRQGPWRWLAGAEWALASALAVVIVSLLGAPVLQESVKNVSGTVRINAPSVAPRGPAITNPSNDETQRIGQGPGNLARSPMYEVQMDELRYLRTRAFDFFTGRGWRSLLSTAHPLDGFGPSSGQAAQEEIDNPSRIRWEVKGLTSSPIIPVPGEPISVSPPGNVERRSDGMVVMSTRENNPVITGVSVVPDRSTIPTAAVHDLPDSLVRTATTSDTPSDVVQFARNAAGATGSDYEKARRIQRAITAQVRYNLRAAAVPQGVNPVSYFLFESREGYCDLFASAMVLSARAVGIPARYVVGYLPDAQAQLSPGRYLVLQSDAHAWAELFFEGVGWVIFDATEGADEAANAGRGSTPADSAWYNDARIRRALDVTLSVGVIVMLFLGYRLWKGSGGPQTTRVKVQRLYIRFAALLYNRTGKRRHQSQTAYEYLQVVRPDLNGSYSLAEEITEKVVRALFSPAEPSDEDVKELELKLAEFRSALKLDRKDQPTHALVEIEKERTPVGKP